VAETTKLDFTIELRPDLPATIQTDPQRLQQVLNNLLSNAFKFTEKGRVEFRSELATSGWSPGHEALDRAAAVIAMSVSDTGIGIPLQQQKTIFEAFAQGDGTTSRKYGGTGLGLSICRDLTGLLAGEITIQSEPGVGSTFTLYLPSSRPPVARSGGPRRALSNGEAEVRKARGTRTAVVAPERTNSEHADAGLLVADDVQNGVEHETSLAGRTVLVVDDDIRNIFALTALLERQGMQVTSVDSGGEALATLRDVTDIEIALVDVMMPEMDGYATISHMRSLPNFGERPIIALTAKAMKGDREKCMEAGASDYIAKPVDSSHLVAMLRSWLSH
jgi:CheY-like chemotaxis protein